MRNTVVETIEELHVYSGIHPYYLLARRRWVREDHGRFSDADVLMDDEDRTEGHTTVWDWTRKRSLLPLLLG